jgi:hypothetical protein
MKRTFFLLLAVIMVFAVFALPVSAGNKHLDSIRYQLGTGVVKYDFSIGIDKTKDPPNPGTPVGTVTVWADNDQSPSKLYVKMTLFSENEYTLYQSHLAVATQSWAETHQFADQPGQMVFQTTGYYGTSYNHPTPYPKTYTYEIALSLLGVGSLQGGDDGDWLAICVHARLANGLNTDAGTIYATGTGDFIGFVPELPAGVLLGIALTGVGTFIFIRRKNILSR